MTQQFDSFLFGGDWNPEQWPEETWEQDVTMLEHAHMNEATINVFSWTLLQPDEHTYDFSKLDAIIALLVKHNFNIVLATATAAVPAWMSRLHPEVLRANIDGVRNTFGGRHNFCPTSDVFRSQAKELTTRIAQRYAGTPGLQAWHVNNEYGNGGGICYCENCAQEFRLWLKKKYGTIEALNQAWCMNFWSHTITAWEDVMPPLGTGDGIGTDKSVISGLLIDYRRFQNEAMLDCFIIERDAIRQNDETTPITTNLMSTFKDLDYFAWGREMDIVSWDNYPGMDTPASFTAMRHDLMRGVGGGKSFMLMEQTPNQQNWFPFCEVKQPGEVRALSWHAVAHGADTVQFFQLRQSIGGCERFHGAIIGHDGTENTRVFKETTRLGEELQQIGTSIMGSAVRSRVAIIFDWESYWSLEACVGPTKGLRYPDEVHRFYKAFHSLGLSVDVIPSTADAQTLAKYAIVAAPTLIMVKPGVAQSLEEYVRKGGRFITGYMSGLHDEHDLIVPGGYPGELRSLTGVWVEEIDAMAPEASIEVRSGESASGETDSTPAIEGQGTIVASIMHLEGAKPLARYGGDGFYAGTTAVSEHDFGKGRAYFVGTALDEGGMKAVAIRAIDGLDLECLDIPEGADVAVRYAEDGSRFVFVTNLESASKRIVVPWLAGEESLVEQGIAAPDYGVEQSDAVIAAREDSARKVKAGDDGTVELSSYGVAVFHLQ